MCGIGGIVARPDAPRVERNDLERLDRALSHRGPDGAGHWTSADGAIGLVHRRLSILDLSERGRQPMASADGRHVLVYNGEIFNFVELRAELEALGSRFRTDTDSEIILEGWRHWGAAMLPRFNGMWAFALVDTRSGEVFLARDRFGIKPLLYVEHGGRIAFASEQRALLALPWVPRAVDPDVAARQLFDPFSIEGTDRSLFRAIRRLPGGHCAQLVDGRLDVRRWWSTVDHLPVVPESPAARQALFRETFFDAVRLRLRSDVPVGTCLSGGFDSSAVVCAMAHIARAELPHVRESRDWQRAFVASFPGKSNDETPDAMEVAEYAGVRAHVLELTDADALDDIERVLDDLDDVYLGIPTAPWLIYRFLRRSGTVVSLDGHGADELMGAYRQQGRAATFALQNLASRLVSGRTLAPLVENTKAAWLASRGLNFLRGHRWSAPVAPIAAPDADLLPGHWGNLNRRLYRMFHSTVLPTILRNFDRLSMAHGVEVRMPFMDWRLVCATMAMPDEAKLTPRWTKAVAREAMAGHMPERIRTATRKVGFNSPMPEWLTGPLAPWVDSVLAKPVPLMAELVDLPALRGRVRALTAARTWDWESAGRLWPYVHMNWYLGRHGAA